MAGKAGPSWMRRSSSATSRRHPGRRISSTGTMPPSDEARDQRPFDEVDDLGSDPEPGCDAGRLVLRGPVDAEELGVRTRDPKHVRLLVDADDEVVVRDPAAERLDVELPIRPHARRYLLRPHRAILSRSLSHDEP